MTRKIAVITGADHPTGLGTARALADTGCQIIGFYKNDTYSTASNCWGRLIKLNSWDDLLLTLIDLGKNLSEKAALFITQDFAVKLISDNRTRLEPYYHCPLPAPGIVDTLLDKALFHNWALQHHLPVPQSQICSNRQQLIHFLQQTGYPAIIKPFEKSERWETFSPLDKAFVLHSEDDLASISFDLFEATVNLVAQKYIPGGDDNVYFCLVCYNQKGQYIGGFSGQKLFQWPLFCGNTAACIAVDNPELEALTRHFFDLAGYRGLGSMEYKLNESDGCYYMIEPTIGRNDFQSNVALAGGVNLAHMSFSDMFGLELPAYKCRPSVWINEDGLIESVRASVKRKEPVLKNLLKLFKRHIAFSYLSWRDPSPLLKLCTTLFKRALKKLRQKTLTPITQKFGYWVDAYYLFHVDCKQNQSKISVLPDGYSLKIIEGDIVDNSLVDLWIQENPKLADSQQATKKITTWLEKGYICFAVYYNEVVVGMSWLAGVNRVVEDLPFACFVKNEPHSALAFHVYVNSSHRKKGLHTYMIEQRNRYAAENGVNSIFVFVGVNNLLSATNIKHVADQYKAIVHFKIDVPFKSFNFFPGHKKTNWKSSAELI